MPCMIRKLPINNTTNPNRFTEKISRRTPFVFRFLLNVLSAKTTFGPGTHNICHVIYGFDFRMELPLVTDLLDLIQTGFIDLP